MQVLLRRITDLCRQQGVASTALYCVGYLWRLPRLLKRLVREIAYDREMGVQTSRLVAVTDLDVDPSKLTDVGTGARGTAYMPSPRWALTEDPLPVGNSLFRNALSSIWVGEGQNCADGV